jgi:two-component system response regulator MprA
MGTNGAGATVLVAEDDRSVRESIVLALEVEGYEVRPVPNGAEALDAVAAEEPDAILLDIMMPVVDGLTVCRRLRTSGCHTPILMLTARHEVSDRVSGLDAGADDYLPKPFSLDELLARLRALLRRTSVSGTDELLRVGDLELDPQRRTAARGGRDLELTKTEFDLLELLMLNAGIVLSRDTIYDRIWGFDFETSSRSLDVYIGYLRRKTEADGEPRLVHTVRGVGYVVRES